MNNLQLNKILLSVNICWKWIRTESVKLGIDVIVNRFDNGFDIRHAFVTMRCERSGKYQQPIRKLKHDDTRLRKCECPFKVHGYHKTNSI